MELPTYQSVAGSNRRRRVGRLPPWLRKRFGSFEPIHAMKKDLHRFRLNTVCEEAQCPNIGECWSQGTATFMILGDICTRHCGFCSVTAGTPRPVDPEEPAHLAAMVAGLKLKHVVITCVARDDLADKGADQFVKVIQDIRERAPQTRVEVLTTDFHLQQRAIEVVCDAGPDVFNHNIETVERLSPQVRHRASYQNSLEFLRRIKTYQSDRVTKSGLMLGLGESRSEIRRALQDLREVGCEIVTIGQYLQPTAKNLPVSEYVHPDVFQELEDEARSLGFRHVASGPYVRSSYHAGEMLTI